MPLPKSAASPLLLLLFDPEDPEDPEDPLDESSLVDPVPELEPEEVSSLVFPPEPELVPVLAFDDDDESPASSLVVPAPVLEPELLLDDVPVSAVSPASSLVVPAPVFEFEFELLLDEVPASASSLFPPLSVVLPPDPDPEPESPVLPVWEAPLALVLPSFC